MINFRVDTEKCVRCGACVSDCPMGIIHMEEGQVPRVTREEKCLKCQHCLAVCPVGAVSVLGVDPEACRPLPDKSDEKRKWFEGLIMGRRSVRRYLPEDVPAEKVAELLDIASYSPTGHNDRTVHFSVVQGRDAMKAIKERVYSDLAEFLARKPCSKDLQTAMLGWALSKWKKGIDAIFRDAPGLLVTHAPKDAATPMEDCLVAMTTFDLAAQAAGLGTQWNGVAKWVIEDFCPAIKAEFGIPEDHLMGYAMIFGKPAVTYYRTVKMDKARIYWVRP